ncbi:hypothetical protein OH77DRAFT_1589745 [Trametes cingulata]|nr:hypothetical protein OH77DRAFT_1589745 [Trametes cingulata]
MPFQIPSVRIAQASPSISLEKGSYRMRAPPARLAPSTGTREHAARAKADAVGTLGRAGEFVPASYERRMALLVALLACAMLASFGTAYWLWTTAHEHRDPR